MTDTIHIVVATDANYLIHTATLLQSIADNCHSPVVMHVLESGIGDPGREMLSGVSYSIACRFYQVDDTVIQQRLFNGGAIGGDRSLSSFARLMIPELLDADIHRCLYMDVDAIVLSDLNSIYAIDLVGYAIAGVLDANPVRRHLSVGLSPADVYINSGMILWNLDYCRQHNVVDRFASFIAGYNGNVDAMDQGTLNGVLSKETFIISPSNNMLTAFFQLTAQEISHIYGVKTYTQPDYEAGRKSPVFVHFTPNLTTRPWVKNCRHPLKNLYWKYRLKVDPAYRLQRDTRPAKIKMLSWLFYNCKPIWRWLITK